MGDDGEESAGWASSALRTSIWPTWHSSKGDLGDIRKAMSKSRMLVNSGEDSVRTQELIDV